MQHDEATPADRQSDFGTATIPPMDLNSSPSGRSHMQVNLSLDSTMGPREAADVIRATQKIRRNLIDFHLAFGSYLFGIAQTSCSQKLYEGTVLCQSELASPAGMEPTGVERHGRSPQG